MEDEITQWLKALPSSAGAYIFKSLDIITNESSSQWYQVTMYDSNFYPNSIGIMCLNASVAFEFPWWISQKFCLLQTTPQFAVSVIHLKTWIPYFMNIYRIYFL